MDNNDHQNLFNRVKLLMAENESLKAMIKDCEHIAAARQNSILELRLRLHESSEAKSHLDGQSAELAQVKNLVNNINRRSTAGVEYNPENPQQYQGRQDDLMEQLSGQQRQFALLKTQVTDLQLQLQELRNRNLILQQQSAPTAELQSLLANAEQERDEWKALAKLKK